MNAVKSAVPAVAEVCRAHRWVPGVSVDMCSGCDWRGNGHETHQAELAIAALADAGFAVMPKRLLMAWQS